MTNRLLLLLLCLAAPGLSCDKPKGATAGAAVEVVVAPVAKQDVKIAQEWVGTTTGFVNAKIYPKVQGYLLKQAYRDGDVVKAGELLFEIDPRQYQAAYDQARGQLGRARAALGKAEQDVARYTPLATQGAVSQQELDDAVQARAAARADVNSASAALENARLELEWTRVRSPIDGIAGIANAQLGDLVRPVTVLTEVSQVDPIKVSIQVSEIEYLRFAKRIEEGEKTGRARQSIELILADGSRYPHPGRFSVAGLGVSKTTGTIELQGVFPNPDNLLRPGQFAMVRAVTEHLPDALLVPQRAVRDLQGLNQVAVVGADDKVAFKTVKLGPSTGHDYVVASGLAAKDRVVVEGLQKIRDGMEVRVVSAADVASGSPAAKGGAPDAKGGSPAAEGAKTQAPK